MRFDEFYRIVFNNAIPVTSARLLFAQFAQNDDELQFEQLLLGLAILTAAGEQQRREYLSNKAATDSALSAWIEQPPMLCTSDADTPSRTQCTFYEALADVTHCL